MKQKHDAGSDDESQSKGRKSLEELKKDLDWEKAQNGGKPFSRESLPKRDPELGLWGTIKRDWNNYKKKV